jgi:hypothetical protein
MLIYRNFIFDFLDLENVYFYNYFASEAHKMSRFLNYLKYSQFVLY